MGLGVCKAGPQLLEGGTHCWPHIACIHAFLRGRSLAVQSQCRGTLYRSVGNLIQIKPGPDGSRQDSTRNRDLNNDVCADEEDIDRRMYAIGPNAESLNVERVHHIVG
jgi:hypothetical protein